jgi:hypothetical protein
MDTDTLTFLGGAFSVRAAIHPPNGRSPARIKMTAEDRPIVEAAQELFKCGSLETTPMRKNPEIDLWVWSVQGSTAIEVLERLEPYLMGKNGERARLALARHGKATRHAKQQERKATA